MESSGGWSPCNTTKGSTPPNRHASREPSIRVDRWGAFHGEVVVDGEGVPRTAQGDLQVSETQWRVLVGMDPKF